MNILFCQKFFNPSKGGIGKVTWVLIRAFRRLGINVHVIAIKNTGYFGENVVYMPSGNFDDSSENKSFLSNFIRENSIDVLINQEGLGRYGFDLFRKVCANKCALVSVVHSQPLGAVKNFIYSKRLKFQKYKLVWLLNLLWVRPLRDIVVFLYKLKYVGHFRKLCEFSDRVVLLSRQCGRNSEPNRYFRASFELQKKETGFVGRPCRFGEASRRIYKNLGTFVFGISGLGGVCFGRRSVSARAERVCAKSENSARELYGVSAV